MPTVLIADDDPDLLAALSEALDGEGWTVLAAASGTQARELAQSKAIDVVLADLSLVERDRPTLEQAFHGLGPAGVAPFVFMTGSTLRARELGGAVVLMKPFEVAEIRKALEETLLRHDRDSALPALGATLV